MNGNVFTALIVALLVVIGFFAVRKYVKSLRYGCCGGSGETKVKVSDKNAAHYPYSVTLKVEGMHCANCTARVENALNRLDGVWAKVSLKRAEAVLRSKSVIDDETLRTAVARAGYKVTEIVRG